MYITHIYAISRIVTTHVTESGNSCRFATATLATG